MSLLDQCIAFYLGEKLTYDNVLEVLGTVDIQVYSDLLDMILSQDINGVMDLLEDVARQGREWSQFITDFLWFLRNLLLVGQGTDAEEALEYFEEAIALNPNYTLAYFNAGRASQEMGFTNDAANYYQMAIDLNRLTEELDEEDIQERLHSLFEI